MDAMKYFTMSVALISVMGITSICVAQEGVGVLKPPPAQGRSFGIDFGLSRNTQQGSFSCPCGAMFASGSGNGFSGSMYFELPAGSDLSVGLKAGFDQKSTTNTQLTSENVIIETPQGDTSPVSLSVNRVGTVTLSFLQLEPFAQYQVLHTNFFVQLGAGVSMLASSSLSQKREMTSGSITLSERIDHQQSYIHQWHSNRGHSRQHFTRNKQSSIFRRGGGGL